MYITSMLIGAYIILSSNAVSSLLRYVFICCCSCFMAGSLLLNDIANAKVRINSSLTSFLSNVEQTPYNNVTCILLT